MKAIVLVGVSGSGKTTIAEEICRKNNIWVNVNRDDLRFSLTGAKNWKDYKFSKSTENTITSLQETAIVEAAMQGKNVIISDTNLNPKTRNKWDSFLHDLRFEVEFRPVYITWEEAVKRDAGRDKSVGQEVLYKQWKQWLQYLEERGEHKFYQPNWNDKLTAIFDIDGTLARMVDRGPFDWNKVNTDEPRREICDMLEGFKGMGYHIIYLSGRDGVCYNDTLDWLIEHVDEGVSEANFFMRSAGDSRKDYIIKSELFWNNIADNYNVQIVVDDRNQVLHLWEDIGIPNVISVGDIREIF